MNKKVKAKVAIINYGMSNLFSVEQACNYVNLAPVITDKPDAILDADALILPGVGAFGHAMDQLHELGLVEPIHAFVSSGKPFLGICLGMQLLFSRSEEFGSNKGLDIIKGDIIRFPEKDESKHIVRIPQINWNNINSPDQNNNSWEASPLKDTMQGAFMYFVHSFYAKPDDPATILSKTQYGGIDFCSSLIHENIFATQFHPEKSAAGGLNIYRNWANYVQESME